MVDLGNRGFKPCKVAPNSHKKSFCKSHSGPVRREDGLEYSRKSHESGSSGYHQGKVAKAEMQVLATEQRVSNCHLVHTACMKCKGTASSVLTEPVVKQ